MKFLYQTMMPQISRKYIYILLILIVVASITINSLFYIISDFYPLLSDTARLACGVKNLVENHSLNNENFYTNFTGIGGDVCWGGNIYMPTRVLASAFAFLSPKITPWVSQYIFLLIIIGFLPILFFLIARRIFNEKTALVSAFFGAFAPFVARSVLVHPQNLVGFTLILLFILFFIRYLSDKKKYNLIIAILIFLAFPYFHHLSFSVLLLSLIFYFILTTKIKRLFSYLVILLFIIPIVYFFTSKYPIEFLLNVLNNSIEGGQFWASSIKKPFWEIPSYVGYLLFGFGLFGLTQYISNISRNKSGSPSSQKFFLALFLTPLLFSQLYLIGFNFFSFRIIAYVGIPLIIFSGYGFFALKNLFSQLNLKKLFFFIALLIFLGSIGHYFTYLVNIYQTRNLEYLPRENMIKTIKWLNEHSNKNTVVLTTVEIKNKQTVSFAYLYKGSAVYYPAAYFENPKSLKFLDDAARSKLDPEITKIQPQHLLGKIVLRFPYFQNARKKTFSEMSKDYDKLKKLNNLIIYPDNYVTLNYNNHDISYVVFKKDGWADNRYQKKAKFKVIYENEGWRVYDAKSTKSQAPNFK